MLGIVSLYPADVHKKQTILKKVFSEIAFGIIKRMKSIIIDSKKKFQNEKRSFSDENNSDRPPEKKGRKICEKITKIPCYCHRI